MTTNTPRYHERFRQRINKVLTQLEKLRPEIANETDQELVQPAVTYLDAWIKEFENRNSLIERHQVLKKGEFALTAMRQIIGDTMTPSSDPEKILEQYDEQINNPYLMFLRKQKQLVNEQGDLFVAKYDQQRHQVEAEYIKLADIEGRDGKEDIRNLKNKYKMELLAGMRDSVEEVLEQTAFMEFAR